MALLRKSPEERAEAQARYDAIVESRRLEKENALASRAQEAFDLSPAGQARGAFERGDYVFKWSMDLMIQTGRVSIDYSATTIKQSSTDATAALNAISCEGWELVTGSFVFIEHGHQSRDKLILSGQQVAISGTTVGYYLFRRAEKSDAATHGSSCR